MLLLSFTGYAEAPNEKELSHRWRHRALVRSLTLKSCESYSLERPAVGCSDLLDVCMLARDDRFASVDRARNYKPAPTFLASGERRHILTGVLGASRS